MLIFLRSAGRRNFPLGFLCANMGLAYLEKGSTVMIPYLWIRANSTIRSSFKWIGIRRIWFYIALSSFGVSFILNSVFISKSILCLSKMLWSSTRISSIACVPLSVKSVFSPIKPFEEFVLGFHSLLWTEFSFSSSSINSLRLRVCIGVWSSDFPGFSGIGNQKVLFCCSGLLAVRSFFW